MGKLSTFFKPYFICFIVLFGSALVYVLYLIGVIDSFKISHKPQNFLGYLMAIVYYVAMIFLTYVFCHTKSPVQNDSKIVLRCMNEKKIYRLSIIYMALSALGLFRLLLNLRSQYSFLQILQMSVRYDQMTLLNTGSGNTILVIFSIVSLIMLGTIFEARKLKWWLFCLTNILLLFIYATVLSSRILIIQGIVFMLLPIVRKKLYHNYIKWKKIIALALVALVFLIITSGYRDFDREGYKYTDSHIKWGISRVADYVVSTTNYSIEANNIVTSFSKTSFPKGTLEIFTILDRNTEEYSRSEYRKEYGSMEYTNSGSFLQIFGDWLWLFPIFVIILTLLYSWLWAKFHNGKLLGIMIYPIMFYGLLEIWRTFYIGTLMAECTLLLTLLTYYMIKKNYLELPYVD